MIFDFDLDQRSGCIDFVDLGFPSSFFIVFVEFDFKEFGKVLKEIVFVNVTAGQNGDIEISISSSKSTDQRSEFGELDLDAHLFDFFGASKSVEKTLDEFVFLVDFLFGFRGMFVEVLVGQRPQLFVELNFNVSLSQLFSNEPVDCLDNFIG